MAVVVAAGFRRGGGGGWRGVEEGRKVRFEGGVSNEAKQGTNDDVEEQKRRVEDRLGGLDNLDE